MLAGATLFGRRGSGVAVNLPLASLAGKVAGGLTYARASGQWYQDDAGVWQYVAANVPAFNSKGILLEPPSTNKCTCYGVIPADSYAAAVTSGAVLVLGRKYEIVTQVTTDFTAKGAANNTVGTQFVLTSACTLGAGDSVKEVQFGIGTKSYHNGTAFVQNHTNMTLSGDTAAVLTTVDGTADVLAAKLQNVATSGKVYKVVTGAGGGASVAIGGTSTATTTSIQAHIMGGTGFIRLTGDRGKVAYGAAATMTQRKSENITSVSGDQMIIDIDDNQTVYFLLVQPEDLPSCTSPIPTAGATATRAATALSFATAGNVSDAAGAIYAEVTPLETSGVLRNIVGTSRLLYLNANQFRSFDGTTLLTWASNVVADTSYKLAIKWGPSGRSLVGSGQVRATSAYDGSLDSGGSIGLGGMCYIKNLRIYRKPLSDAQLIAMTT